MAITSHHGDVVRNVSSGFRITVVSTFLIGTVIGEKVSVIQVVIVSTGSDTENGDRLGELGRVDDRRGEQACRDEDDRQDDRDQAAARPDLGATDPRIEPLAGRVRQPVQDDREDDDGQSGLERGADVMVRQGRGQAATQARAPR